MKPDGVPAVLLNVIAGAAGRSESTESVAWTALPVGGVPEAVATLCTTPASTSAWISVYVLVQVVCAPGVSVVAGHETPPTVGSFTPTELRVTLPVLVTTKL